MRMTLFSLLSCILCYWIYLSIQISAATGKCLEDQQSLLLQLKNSLELNLVSSAKLYLWNQSTACCDWSGVSCDKDGHVIGLDLSGESITGGFDNSSILFSFQHLQKLNLASNNFNSAIPSGFNKLDKLTYLNLSYAGFVGQIPVEISLLKSLVTLDISSFSYLTPQEMKLENPNLQKLLQNLTSIRQLYLDGVRITDKGKEWCDALQPLRGLQELSMSYCNLLGPLDSSLTRLENLSVIILDGNNFSSPVPETFVNFKKLTTLSLAFCALTGRFPEKIFQNQTLSVIDISLNNNLHGLFPDFPINGSLQTFRVSRTSFSGEFPSSIANMRYLSELDLSSCQFNGTLPTSLSNLTELSYLDLSFNSFTGPLPSFAMAKKLTHLYLSRNGLSGAIPSTLFTLPSLQKILLSFNQFSQLEGFRNASASKLNTLDLSSNKLSGPFPATIFQLATLSILKLSSNKFNGTVELNKLLELRNLTELDLSHNNLSINVNVTNAEVPSFPKISNLNLAFCNLKTFPDFLRNQSSLSILDLSDNQIQGKVPNWVWKLQNLYGLNISHNLLTGFEGPLQNLTSNLIVLDLHDNQLQGPIPVFPEYAVYLDYSSNKFDKFGSVIPQDIGDYLSPTIYLSLSNNRFHGSIPDSLCSAINLQVLDLSINNISGTIPSCLITMTETLGVLNLRMNNLRGLIPDTFPASCVLRTLDLQKNKLHGQIPKSLANCSPLEVLDLANNQIADVFPCMLKSISTLRVLVLRKNKFHGPIGCPKNNGTWKRLQIVDLAFNNFTGKLPGKIFRRWEAMMFGENQTDSKENHIRFQVLEYGQIYFQDSVTVTSKGQGMELVKILTVFTSIDFSSNHFQGEIPKELFDFKALYVLNLSNNALSGQIPSSIGNLIHLESLDLSQNSLAGEIPNQLSSLSFLSYLNLSFNHLVGVIPTGTQLQSFQASSFEGNYGLYGPPLTEKPDDKKQGLLPHPTCKELACSVDWSFISMELGFIFGLGIVIGPVLFWKQWRVWYWQIVDRILCWIFPHLYLECVNHRGQWYQVLRWWWH